MHYYQFNLSNYITATAHLTPMQDIAYRRLLDYYYEKEAPIPNETEWVSNRLRLVSEKEAIESVLKEFFTLSGENVWVHDVCDVNIAAYQKRCKTNKANSIKGGRPKKTRSVSNRNPTETLANNHKPITNNHKDQKKKAKIFVLPDWIDPDVWKGFIEHRQKLKAPMTDRAKTLTVNKLKTLAGHPSDILNQSIFNGWKGIFELTEDSTNGQKPTASRAKQHQDKLREIAERDVEQSGNSFLVD